MSGASAAQRVSDLGEFGLIARLAALLEPSGPAPGDAALLVGIGDDAAAWRPSPGACQVVTTDLLVAGVHFDLRTTSWRDLGWKAIAENLSDLAAMAARPRQLLIALALADDPLVAEIEDLYRGMRACAERYGAQIVGGDTSSAPVTLIAVTAIGESDGPLLRRSAGRPGDLLAVTGALGGSAGGLLVLQGQACPAPADAAELVALHRRPTPRVAEALVLARAGVRCGLDVSDGLLGDTAHICEQSGLGALLYYDQLPAPAALQRAFPEAWRDLALGGGEDYELLVAAPPEVLAAARAALQAETGTPLTVVGELTPPPREPERPLVRVVDGAGREVQPRARSWVHFKR